ncbi:hypothetical protein BKA69DRAFT_1122601 [Paraphysoderma sedebokerense]|nr:hypothetical protein BKA69DRAFT_1122601 [Paraphysoderma sedebokerense]
MSNAQLFFSGVISVAILYWAYRYLRKGPGATTSPSLQQSQDFILQENRRMFEIFKLFKEKIQAKCSSPHEETGNCVHIGILHIGVKNIRDSVTDRYIIAIPNYNPKKHGYIFDHKYPFICVKYAGGLSSRSYYQHLKDDWNRMTNNLNKPFLSNAAPIEIHKYNDVSKEFQLLHFRQSDRHDESVKVEDNCFQCWIHGPQSQANKKALKNDETIAPEAAKLITKYEGAEESEKKSLLNTIVSKFRSLRTISNSGSYPTKQIEIKNPLSDRIDFHVSDPRLSVGSQGGQIGAKQKNDNDVHIRIDEFSQEEVGLEFEKLWGKVMNQEGMKALSKGNKAALKVKVQELFDASL